MNYFRKGSLVVFNYKLAVSKYPHLTTKFWNITKGTEVLKVIDVSLMGTNLACKRTLHFDNMCSNAAILFKKPTDKQRRYYIKQHESCYIKPKQPMLTPQQKLDKIEALVRDKNSYSDRTASFDKEDVILDIIKGGYIKDTDSG